MKRSIIVLIVLLASFGLVFAQGSKETQTGASSGDSPIVVKYAFWGNPDAIGVEKDIIDAFEAQNPNIKIETVVSGFNDYHTKIMTMIAGNMAPDVMRIDSYYFQDFVDLNAIESIDSFVERDNIDMSMYPPQGLEEGSYRGKLYGLPFAIAPMYMIINLNAFEKEGVPLPSLDWSVDDFEKIVRQFDGARTGTYGYAFNLDNLPSLIPFVWANGGSLLNEDRTQYTLDTPEGAKGIQMIADLYQQGYIPRDAILPGNTDTLRRWFINGTIAMMMASAQQILAIQNVEGVAFEAWPMPQGVTEHTTAYKGNSISISAASKQKEAAWTFLKFLRGIEGEMLYLGAKRMPPTMTDPSLWTLYLDAGKYPMRIQEVSSLIIERKGHVLPLRSGYSEIEQEAMTAVSQAILGNKTALQAFQDIRPKVETIIRRNTK